ncbi:hypothetical protein, partial [Mycobacterium intracellulare]|uniref:hypothetical protein n=1 Tax=Mycobacterium intracellulare TaxID=1767 RepID=UPI001F36909B
VCLLKLAYRAAVARPKPSPSTSDRRGLGKRRLLGGAVPLSSVLQACAAVPYRTLVTLKISDRKRMGVG